MSDDAAAVVEAISEFFGEAPTARTEVGAVSVVVFEDEPDDDEEEPRYYFVSVGLSSRPLAAAPAGAELVLTVQAALDEDGVAALSEVVGHLASAFLHHQLDVAPGALVETGPLPIFLGMDQVLITAWGDGGELDRLSPPRSLLSMNPLTREEVESIEGAEPDGALAWLSEQGVDVDDPLRLSRQAMEETWSAAEALSRGDSFAFAQAMEATAGRIRDLAIRTMSEGGDTDVSGVPAASPAEPVKKA